MEDNDLALIKKEKEKNLNDHIKRLQPMLNELISKFYDDNGITNIQNEIDELSIRCTHSHRKRSGFQSVDIRGIIEYTYCTFCYKSELVYSNKFNEIKRTNLDGLAKELFENIMCFEINNKRIGESINNIYKNQLSEKNEELKNKNRELRVRISNICNHPDRYNYDTSDSYGKYNNCILCGREYEYYSCSY
jgi:gas vesicle protein